MGSFLLDIVLLQFWLCLCLPLSAVEFCVIIGNLLMPVNDRSQRYTTSKKTCHLLQVCSAVGSQQTHKCQFQGWKGWGVCLRSSQKAAGHLLPSAGRCNKSMCRLHTLTTHLPLSMSIGKVFLCVEGGEKIVFAPLLSVLVTLNCLAFWFIKWSRWVLPILACLCWYN